MAKRDELLDHDYDGITEYDNPLPNWWKWIFYLTIAFSVFYLPYTFFGFAPSTAEEYDQEIAAAKKQYPALAVKSADNSKAGAPSGQSPEGQSPEGQSPEGSSAAMGLAGNAEAIEAGKALYMTNCSPCHGKKGEGGIGPNLTDKHWLHGNTYEHVVRVITNGVPAKGMIAWKAVLNPTKINQAAAFVLSLQGTNPPNAKAPQGQAYPK